MGQALTTIKRFDFLGADTAPDLFFVRANMTLDKRTRKRLLDYCAELHDDDGIDPRHYFKHRKKRDKNHRKSRQLCKQVAETLELALSGDFGDERLQSLHVVRVEPAPDASQLCVIVCTDDNCSIEESQEILDCLATVNGKLRSEIAAAISRKRTPKLLFHVIGPSDAGEEQQ